MMSDRKKTRYILRLGQLVWLCALLASPALAATESTDKAVTLNLQDADIQALINTVSRATGKNFVVDPRVKAKVNVVSARPMDDEKLYDTFLSILQVHGFTAVPAGEVIKIVPDVQAKQSAVPTPGTPSTGGDQMVTRVIPLEHVDAQPLLTVLRQLMPQQAALAVHQQSNALIVTDRANNIERLRSIVRRIDHAESNEIEVIKLRHASAEKVVETLEKFQQQANGTKNQNGHQLTVAADTRTNSLLMSAGPTQRLRVRTLIAHLDTPLAREGNTRVIYLKHAKATELVEIVKSIPEASAAQKKQGDTTNESERVSIQADEATNALVINAPVEVQREIAEVVEQLDIARAQVLVEAIIAEVSEDLSRELGVQMAVDGTSDDSGPVGATVFGSQGNILNLASPDTAANALGQGLNLAVGEIDRQGLDFAVLLKALNGDAATNILSTPSILTLDNQEASIVVGQNVPFVTGSYSSTGDTTTPTNPFQTIEREDVGLTLKVKPQINEGDSITMEIEQEVSNIASTAQNASDLITNTRKLNTTVQVRDSQLIVLGGLTDETVRDSLQKVPGLGDIPLLGKLFQYKTASKAKQNLMVFLRPVIMRDLDLSNRYTRAKYEQLRATQQRYREDREGLSTDAAILPSLDTLLTEDPVSIEP